MISFSHFQPMMSRVCILLSAIGQVAPEQYGWLARLRRIAMGLDFFSCMSYPRPFCLSMAYGVFAFVDMFACLRGPLFMLSGGCCTPIFILHSNLHSAICSVLKTVAVP
jgi:hypothetical protein